MYSCGIKEKKGKKEERKKEKKKMGGGEVRKQMHLRIPQENIQDMENINSHGVTSKGEKEKNKEKQKNKQKE